ncbi:MAG: DUF4416 family protein [Candidatus Margulisiibacteriota bacterium]
MGKPKAFDKLKLFIGILVNEKFVDPYGPVALLLQILEQKFGKIDYKSAIMPFMNSDYYFAEMGQPLYKFFVSFKSLIDVQDFAAIKLFTNDIEDQFAEINSENQEIARQVNLDPGVMSLHNVMLLTTKNFAHRIPLKDGVYIEVTLIWKNKGYQDCSWTYPDFKTVEYKEILKNIRSLYNSNI